MLAVLEPKLAPDAHAYVFCDAVSYPKFLPYFERAFDLRNLLVWEKGESGPGAEYYAPNFELIIFGTRKGARSRPLLGEGRPGSILRYQAPPPGGRDHPTPKPVDLLKFLIEQSTGEDDLVADPYAGSGSTGVACVRTGRRYFLVEKDKATFDYASAWIADVENMIEPDDSVELPPARPRTIKHRHSA
jgi:site-specific DNA-methyltransferase (adenine-specific)